MNIRYKWRRFSLLVAVFLLMLTTGPVQTMARNSYNFQVVDKPLTEGTNEFPEGSASGLERKV